MVLLAFVPLQNPILASLTRPKRLKSENGPDGNSNLPPDVPHGHRRLLTSIRTSPHRSLDYRSTFHCGSHRKAASGMTEICESNQFCESYQFFKSPNPTGIRNTFRICILNHDELKKRSTVNFEPDPQSLHQNEASHCDGSLGCNRIAHARPGRR